MLPLGPYIRLSVVLLVFCMFLKLFPQSFKSLFTISTDPTTQPEWKAALDTLPATPNNIPAFFFAHGSPSLAFPKENTGGASTTRADIRTYQGPDGPLAKFLRDFGPTLLSKYKPKAILVFSAHWETLEERLVTDYGNENPLLMDYYGFPKALYELKFKSRGDSELSSRVVKLFEEAGFFARTTSTLEARGEDGRGFSGPGFDHGVFVPFRIMFGEEFTDIPIVQASIDASMTPEGNWKIGQAVTQLRKEGVLVLSGGLPIHNLLDFSSFNPDTAKPIYHDFHKALVRAVQVPESEARKKALVDLTSHPGFQMANPREDHFVPLYIAAGAGESEGRVKVLNGFYGIPTVAFGL